MFNRRAWTRADRGRPRADKPKCYNCVNYLEINGRERPQRLEISRSSDSHEFKKLKRSGRKPPKTCEHKGCSSDTYRYYNQHNKYYCCLHLGRAKRGHDMDAAPAVRTKKSKRDREKPNSCEVEGCTETETKYIGPSKKFFCRAHERRARAGKSMVLRSVKPDQCEASTCDRTTIQYHTAHAKWYCSGHGTRATKGQNKDAPIASRKLEVTSLPRIVCILGGIQHQFTTILYTFK